MRARWQVQETSFAMRAYHPDAVARSGGTLVVDVEWYLTQQVRAVTPPPLRSPARRGQRHTSPPQTQPNSLASSTKWRSGTPRQRFVQLPAMHFSIFDTCVFPLLASPTEPNRTEPETKLKLKQVLPPISRLCEPIEGTSAALLAERLGLDGSKFSRSSSAFGDSAPDVDFTPACQLAPAERFKDARHDAIN